jgi:protein tyrosine/serine phosphatase
VIYLRAGHDFGSWALEKEACARHGLALVELPFFSRGLPTRERIAEADRMFADIAYPALMHCKSGADRAGFAAALYLVLAENRPVEEALEQLSLRYGHYRKSPTGVLDQFFEAYLADTRDTPMDFRSWVETRYDPATVEAGFRPSSLGTLLVDTVLRRE